MKTSSLMKFIRSLECQELKDEENVLLYAGRGIGVCDPVLAGNNCRCNGDNCDCNGTILKPVEP